MLSRIQAIALQLLIAVRCEDDCGQPQLLAVGVFLHGQPIEAAKDEQRRKNLGQLYCWRVDGSVSPLAAPSLSCRWWATARAKMRRSRTVGS